MKARVQKPAFADVSSRRNHTKNRTLRKPNQQLHTQKPASVHHLGKATETPLVKPVPVAVVPVHVPAVVPVVPAPAPAPVATAPRKFRVVRSSSATPLSINTSASTEAATNTGITKTTSSSPKATQPNTPAQPRSPSGSPLVSPQASPSTSPRKRFQLDREGLQSSPKKIKTSSLPSSPCPSPSSSNDTDQAALCLSTSAPSSAPSTPISSPSPSFITIEPLSAPSSPSPCSSPLSSTVSFPTTPLAANCSFSSTLTDEYLDEWIDEEEKALQNDISSSHLKDKDVGVHEVQDLAWAEDW